MTAMTGGDAVYETLKALGVKHVFGIISVHNIPIFDAIKRGGDITAVPMRHEQGAAHAADAYARATGKLGVAIVSTGPGTTNVVTGLLEAQTSSSRLLIITGQIESQFYGKGKGLGHEAENQLDMLRTVTRRTDSPRQVGTIPESIMRVAEEICTGRPQPGAVEIPTDMQYAIADVTIPDGPRDFREAPDPTRLAAAADILTNATKRVIWSGGGVIRAEASEELTRLAEALGAPVFTSTNGRGGIAEDHDLSMGPIGARPEFRDAFNEADVVLAVGTRFQAAQTAGFNMKMPGKLIHLDADQHMIDLNYKSDIRLDGDAKLGLSALQEAIGNAPPADADWVGRMTAGRDTARKNIRKQIGPDYELVMDTIRENLPRDGQVVRDSTVPAYTWGNVLFPILEPKTSHHPTTGAIGPGLPFGIGAAIGSGKKTVILQGDGGFMLHIGELAAAAQANAQIIVCVFNDQGYGVLRRIEQVNFDGRIFGADLTTPKFADTAESMGVRGIHVASADEFPKAFADAMAHDGPVLIELDATNMQAIEGFINGPVVPAHGERA